MQWGEYLHSFQRRSGVRTWCLGTDAEAQPLLAGPPHGRMPWGSPRSVFWGVRVPLHQEHTCNGITENVCSDDIQMHQKTVIFQNRNWHLDKELFFWTDFQTQFPLALLTWSLILKNLCYSGGHPAQILPLCSTTTVPPRSQQSDRGACPPLACATGSTWPLLRPVGWKILVHVNKSLLNRLFHMKYQKLTSTNSYL